MGLPADQIHLWLASEEDARCQQLYSDYRAMLSHTEQQQERRFRFARDRNRYLVTRALVRTVLSRYSPVAPAEWVFAVNEYGRPSITNPQAVAAGLSFNVSHTHGLILLAVSADRTIGVDLENVHAREIHQDLADRFFAPCEASTLRALPADRRRLRFLEYWTFKESYVKARGMGLSIPLHEFWFRLPGDRDVFFFCDSSQSGNEARWQFWQFRPTPDYLAAVCAEARDVATRFIVRRAVPLAMQEDAEVTWTRMSGQEAAAK